MFFWKMFFSFLIVFLVNPSLYLSAECPPISETTVRELCSLSPDKGFGSDDLFRYYFNPVTQLCLPFSFSGNGGNANRFLSVKNCYDICHPFDPDVKKPRVVSAIRAYLIPNDRKCSPKTRELSSNLVFRQFPNPLNPKKTLTLIQSEKQKTV
ncbi:kunitz-type serine protease inhibitor mulgin-2-like [Oppia nitens]|uniref:kunitz-type serine protease inhibitor mulgin-2-like n=1 Tax=Oppia nitens TaxID=1686743 RepID=UPI0023DC8ADA|nr:kunitz-type serine protease inhibitor mulgin-2-like [Oppia nitens]